MHRIIDFILLIDDEEATRFLHRIMAEESGICNQIIEAEDADAGLSHLRKLKSENPSASGLIFLDVNMPVTDGWMFLEELNNQKNIDLNDVSIFMVSASDYPKDIDRIQNEPMVKGYVPKPLTAEKIRDCANV